MQSLLRGPASTTAAEATMAELAELLDSASELSETLVGPSHDEEDLERELAMLLQEEEKEKKDEKEKQVEKEQQDETDTKMEKEKQKQTEKELQREADMVKEAVLLRQLEELTLPNDDLDGLLASGDLEPVIGRAHARRANDDVTVEKSDRHKEKKIAAL
jgi:hypothetical protein